MVNLASLSVMGFKMNMKFGVSYRPLEPNTVMHATGNRNSKKNRLIMFPAILAF